MNMPIAERMFTDEDTARFAALSGDANPIHLDAIAARRLLFGRTVVHGVHAAAWALDAYARLGRLWPGSGAGQRRLAVRFLKPIFPGRSVTLQLAAETPERVGLAITGGGDTLIELALRQGAPPPLRHPHTASPSREEDPAGEGFRPPRARGLEELKTAAGALGVPVGTAGPEAFLPAASELLGASGLARLLALSRLVGMECPGLHSLFAGFDVTVPAGAAGLPLVYAVTAVEPRFSLLTMQVSGAVEGTVEAFLRPAPVAQPSMDELKGLVPVGAFAGERPLIVGGSRGLGEVAAKIVAGGGGHPIVTYRDGEAQAQAIVQDIRRNGGACTAVPFDVTATDGPDLPAVLASSPSVPRDWRPNSLYYFATPRIREAGRGGFDPERFRHFSVFYVEAFERIVRSCLAVAGGTLRVFYPSTSALDVPVRDFMEYAAAKAAGETLCTYLGHHEPGLRILVRRLPRLATDQQAGLIRDASENVPETLLRVVQAMMVPTHCDPARDPAHD